MAKHDAISTAAFIPVSGAGSFIEPYSALVFPPAWREAIVKLEQHGKKNPEKYKEVPIRSLNAAIRALAPDLVSVATNAARHGEEPWLYTTSEYPISVLQALIVSWLQTRQPSPDAFRVVTGAFQELNLPALTWELVMVDLLKQGLTAGGTADPEECLYRLLPDVLAARIEQLPAYEYADGEVRFYRVGADYRGGAELISWPPKKYQPKKGEEDFDHHWYYSATIGVSLQTEPFSPVPRIHLSTGIRRWVHGQVHPAGNNATVYLRTEGPWLSGGTGTSRFAAAPIRVRWRREEGEVRASWAFGGPADILSRLSIAQDFPKPADIAQDAEGWLCGRDGVTAVVTYHTAMSQNHGVSVGLMPSERRRLTEWAGTALVPHFEQLGNLRRSRHSQAQSTPKAQLKVHENVPRESKDDATPEERAKNAAERAEAQATNDKIDIENARLRRQFLARAIGGDHVLTCHLLYQTTAVRDALIAAAESSLDLAMHRASFLRDTPEGPWREGTCTWQAPDLEVRMHIREARELVLALGGAEAPKAGKGARAAIADRRVTVRDFLRNQEDSQLALVEIEPRATFKKRTTDPKFAIRLGCADAGRVSQFITPLPAAERVRKGKKKDLAKGLAFRAEASWDDGLRQLGMSFVPQHSLKPDAIPERLNQVAFWIVRRNADAQSRNRQFTPVAVLIRPNQDRVMGRVPGMQQWVPYPELLQRLTGQVRGDDLKTKTQQRTETARFVRQVLYTLRGEPTVVLTLAQNARQSWDWLQNGLLAPDKIQLGDGPMQDLALHGRHLRLIRVRDGGYRHEAPQWWAPDRDDDDEAGLAKGLWVPPGVEDDRRVFYATGAKGVTHKNSGVDHTKLTAHVVVKDDSPVVVTNADVPAWNPTLLEIAVAGCAPRDRPADWAMWVQQQRFPDYYREEGLKLPLVLHLAEQADEYALPHEYAESRLLEEPSDTGSAEADMAEAEDEE